MLPVTGWSSRPGALPVSRAMGWPLPEVVERAQEPAVPGREPEEPEAAPVDRAAAAGRPEVAAAEAVQAGYG